MFVSLWSEHSRPWEVTGFCSSPTDRLVNQYLPPHTHTHIRSASPVRPSVSVCLCVCDEGCSALARSLVPLPRPSCSNRWVTDDIKTLSRRNVRCFRGFLLGRFEMWSSTGLEAAGSVCEGGGRQRGHGRVPPMAGQCSSHSNSSASSSLLLFGLSARP